MTDTADAARSLTHDEAMDCIIGAAGVSVLSYEEAIAAYSRLRHLDGLADRFAAAVEERDAIEAKTIERCAKAVEQISWLSMRVAGAIARVIRALGKSA